MLSTEILIGSLTEIKKSNLHIFSINPPVEVKKMYFADVISCGYYFSFILDEKYFKNFFFTFLLD